MYPLIAVCLLLLTAVSVRAEVFTVASYNVENLFDHTYSGTEYPDYIPDGETGWTIGMVSVKVDRIARVIADLSPDIIGLQEIESPEAFDILRENLKLKGAAYPYAAIARGKATAVKCAVLSRFSILDQSEIAVPGEYARDILRVTIAVSGKPLVVFVNHWKSKTGPESRRIACARALATAISSLPPHADYILLGDFNSNYNEDETISGRRDLNDTRGRTGINDFLKTAFGGHPVSETVLVNDSGKGLHYNLWLEIDPGHRWSAEFRGKGETPDNILLPAALYDSRGISYVDNSFDRFDPGYLFAGKHIFRWQRGNRGRGRHLGKGYSDHLPIYARFTDTPFVFKTITSNERGGLSSRPSDQESRRRE